MRKPYYIRDPETGHVRPAIDVFEFGRYFEWAVRAIERTNITDEIEVSTIFLGIDHNFFDEGEPILFETLVFGGPLDGEMERYETEADARIGHEEMCDRVRDALGE